MTVRPPWAVDGVQAAGADIRLSQGALLAPAGLLRAREGALGAPVVVTAQSTPNRTVSVPAFAVAVDNDGFASGPVTVVNDGPVTVNVAAFETSPRKDIIVAFWVGEEQAQASRKADIGIIKGTAGTTPVAPAVPANALLLATIAVPASPATVITSGNITSNLLQTTALGGVTPSRNAADVVAVYPGQTRVRLDLNGQIEVADNSLTWKVPPRGATTLTQLAPAAPGWRLDAGAAMLRYYRDDNGFVRMFGALVNNSTYTPAGDHPADVLPAGFRPTEAYFFTGSLAMGPGAAVPRASFQFEVRPDGLVYLAWASTPTGQVVAGSSHSFSGAAWPAF